MSDDGWDAAAAGCDRVLHVAAPLGGGRPTDRLALVEPARGGTLRVLRAARRCRSEAGRHDVSGSRRPPARR